MLTLVDYLTPALMGACIAAFLMPLENFNTTLMPAGSDSSLTITMFDRLGEGSTPALNAVSLLLMAASGTLAPIGVFAQREENRPGRDRSFRSRRACRRA